MKPFESRIESMYQLKYTYTDARYKVHTFFLDLVYKETHLKDIHIKDPVVWFAHLCVRYPKSHFT